MGFWLRSLDSMLFAREEIDQPMPLKNDPIAPSSTQRVSLRLTVVVLLALGMLGTSSPGWSQLVLGSMDVHWNEGSPECANSPQPPLQVHQYNARTFILRENLCSTFEAPFMYLLFGQTRALLLDTGENHRSDVAKLDAIK